MKKQLWLFLFLFFPLTLSGQQMDVEAGTCNSDCADSGTAVPVIFDTDMGSDCDDAGALAVLHYFMDRGEAEILGCIYSSGKVPYGAGVVEAINRVYGRPEIPVGACHDTTFGDPVDKMTAQKLVFDTAAYGNTVVHNRDAEASTLVVRRLLARAEDNSVVYLTVGHTRGLYELLRSESDSISPLCGRELVRKKVKRWVALGALRAMNEGGNYARDWNFFSNGSGIYTDYLVEHMEVPAWFVAAGDDVMTGKGLKGLPAGHVVRTIYRDWLWNMFEKTLDDQRPSWDLVAACFAVQGTGEYLYEAEPGYLEVHPEKGCKWIYGENPYSHHLILQKANSAKAFSDYLNRILSGG